MGEHGWHEMPHGGLLIGIAQPTSKWHLLKAMTLVSLTSLSCH